MKQHWQSTEEIKSWNRRFWKIRLLIGTLILVTVLLLSACKQIEYIYVEPERVPITCIDEIKTPLDMAKCLNEYKLRYK